MATHPSTHSTTQTHTHTCTCTHTYTHIHTGMWHVEFETIVMETHMNESWITQNESWLTQNELSGLEISHATRMDRSKIWMGHVTYKDERSHIHETCHNSELVIYIYPQRVRWSFVPIPEAANPAKWDFLDTSNMTIVAKEPYISAKEPEIRIYEKGWPAYQMHALLSPPPTDRNCIVLKTLFVWICKFETLCACICRFTDYYVRAILKKIPILAGLHCGRELEI